MLLTWSSTYRGQTLEVLSGWIQSEEGETLYQRLIEDLLLPQTLEEFALTLAALLCRERLFPYTVDYAAQPIEEDCYLADFDAILNGQDVSNKQRVFEGMTYSLLRVLDTVDTYEEIVRFLVKAYDKEATVLGPLDGVSDQYCAGKVLGLDHNTSFEEAREGLIQSAEAMVNRHRNAGSNFFVLPRALGRLMIDAWERGLLDEVL